MKVAELEGDALDKAVMRGLLDHMVGAPINEDTGKKLRALVEELMQGKPQFHPSRDWAQGGPIIERERINTHPRSDSGLGPHWGAVGEGDDWECMQRGETALIAAMRYYVCRKFGDEVPDVADSEPGLPS